MKALTASDAAQRVVARLHDDVVDDPDAHHHVAWRVPTPADDRLLRDLHDEPSGYVLLMPMDVRETVCEMRFREHRRRVLTDFPRARFRVVVVDGRGVGQLVLSESATEIRVVELTVHRDRRRHGIAMAVLRGIVAQAGGRTVVLDVPSGNQAMLALCRRLGGTTTVGAEVVSVSLAATASRGV